MIFQSLLLSLLVATSFAQTVSEECTAIGEVSTTCRDEKGCDSVCHEDAITTTTQLIVADFTKIDFYLCEGGSLVTCCCPECAVELKAATDCRYENTTYVEACDMWAECPEKKIEAPAAADEETNVAEEPASAPEEPAAPAPTSATVLRCAISFGLVLGLVSA